MGNRTSAPSLVPASGASREIRADAEVRSGSASSERWQFEGFTLDLFNRTLSDASGKEVFFHSSAIWGEGIDNLREGDGVEFELGDGGGKGPRATSVRRTTT